MRYLITSKTGSFEPYFTEYYSEDIHDEDMVVCDLINHKYTYNYFDWKEIAEDHL